jgi:hypothetical protein
MVYERVSNVTFESRAFLVTWGGEPMAPLFQGVASSRTVLCAELIPASRLLFPVIAYSAGMMFSVSYRTGAGCLMTLYCLHRGICSFSLYSISFISGIF